MLCLQTTSSWSRGSSKKVVYLTAIYLKAVYLTRAGQGGTDREDDHNLELYTASSPQFSRSVSASLPPPSILCRINTLENNGNMRFTPAIVASFAATVAAHGDHGHDQEPLAGPHEGLWYNTLPGDGGTQVCASNSRDDAPKQ